MNDTNTLVTSHSPSRRGYSGTAGRLRPRAIVIGAGFGGLAAAVRLGARGYRVTVLDRLDQPGGRARVFHDNGFTFDAGPTVITAPFLFEELWTLAGRRLEDDVELRPVDPFYRIRWSDGRTFDYSGDAERMRREIARIAPEDVSGYERLLDASRRIFEVGFEQLAHVAFHRRWTMARIVTQMVRLGSYRSVYELVARHIRNPHLRQALSFHPLLVGGNPLRTTSIYALIAWLERRWGVHFAMGGTGSLVRGLTDLITDLGGELRMGEEVTEITATGRRATGVRLADGTTMRASIVISNADAAWTYGQLVPPHLRGRWTARRLGASKYSMGLLVWYFGTRRVYPDVPHHTILLGPRYEGLLRDIFEGRALPPDFSLYLHRPTATDPTLAPPGHDAFYVLSPVPNLSADIDWEREAEPYRRRIAQFLDATVLPGVRDTVVTSRVLHPLDFQRDYLSVNGAGFSLQPILTQSAYFRPHNRSESLAGLYLVGAGTHPGAGLPGVLSSARVLDAIVPPADAHA